MTPEDAYLRYAARIALQTAAAQDAAKIVELAAEREKRRRRREEVREERF
jgi:hypothetical protein